MRTILLSICLVIGCIVSAQKNCGTSSYNEEAIRQNTAFAGKLAEVESFIQSRTHTSGQSFRTAGGAIIKVPVVIHILYNKAAENISDAQIKSQLTVLNADFRRLNKDTVNTPARFKAVAADAQIEFVLATADPYGRATNGIVRKATSKTWWGMDDKIKFNSEGGDNAWDSRSYLNIWVGNLQTSLGYGTMPTGDAAKDGIVLNYTAFGTINTIGPYDLGRTAVHEIGHWLGLKHIWGDTYCGDDGAADTPSQSGYTTGCPTTFRSSCNNGPLGDMYMNYMDFTNDACMNLFTLGQVERMRALFTTGGPRASILTSKGLSEPWTTEAPLPDVVINEAKVFPNPANNEISINFGDDQSWIGNQVQVINISGIVLQSTTVKTTLQKINIGALKPGLYLVKALNGDKKLTEKILKL